MATYDQTGGKSTRARYHGRQRTPLGEDERGIQQRERGPAGDDLVPVEPDRLLPLSMKLVMAPIRRR